MWFSVVMLGVGALTQGNYTPADGTKEGILQARDRSGYKEHRRKDHA